jgi:hypothetical protein
MHRFTFPAMKAVPQQSYRIDTGWTWKSLSSRRHGRACPGHPRLGNQKERRGCPGTPEHDEQVGAASTELTPNLPSCQPSAIACVPQDEWIGK